MVLQVYRLVSPNHPLHNVFFGFIGRIAEKARAAAAKTQEEEAEASAVSPSLEG